MTDQTYAYPFDPTGLAATNHVVGEPQILTPPNWNDFYFVIPKAAPFFSDGLTIAHQPSGKVLVEGIDYHLTHQFADASIGTAKAVYGSITILDKTLGGALVLTYQTLGGLWTLDSEKIIEILTDSVLNPRITTWEQVAGMPVAFPPIDHDFNTEDLTGMGEVAEAIEEIADFLKTREDPAALHMADYDNPHRVSKTQVGLGKVLNYGVADQDSAIQGSSNDLYMTPLRVNQVLAGLGLVDVSSHVLDKSNPHDVTKDQVGLGNVLNYGVTSKEDAEAGVSDTFYMTPLKTKDAVAALVGNAFSAHDTDRTNPHAVTKAQVGLGAVENYGVSSKAQAEGGASNTVYMTPLRTKEAIIYHSGEAVSGHTSDVSNPHNVTAEQVDTYDKAYLDNEFSEKLDASATATDTYRLEGLTLAEVIDNVALQSGEGFGQRHFIESATDVNEWILLFSWGGTYDEASPVQPIPYGAYVEETDAFGGVIRNPDLVFMISGHEDDYATKGNAQFVRVGSKPTGDIEILNLTGSTDQNKIGYTTHTDGSYHLWLQAPARRSETVISMLSGVGKWDWLEDRQTHQPPGITYVTPDTILNTANLPKASAAQMTAGTNNVSYVTPSTHKTAVDASLTDMITELNSQFTASGNIFNIT